jgi:hypothetical protein
VPAPGDPGSGKKDAEGPLLSFRGRKGLNRKRGLVRGHVDDPAGIAKVEVALARRKRAGCRWWSKRKGALARRKRRCSRPAWIKAVVRPRGSGGFRWKASLGGRIRDGVYRLRLRAADGLGNETLVRQRLRVD